MANQTDREKWDEICVSTPPQHNKPRKLKYGIGTNDLPHISQFDDNLGKRRMYSVYLHWDNMLKRCCSDVVKLKHPTYKNTSVCEHWLKISNFVSWYKTQYKEEGWQLDLIFDII